MKINCLFFMVAATLGLTACGADNNYEIREVDGKTFLLERNTGQLSIVDKGRVINLEKHSPFSQVKFIANTTIDDLKLNILLKRIEERFFYKVTITGKKMSEPQQGSKSIEWFKEALKNNSKQRIELIIEDEDGIELDSEVVSLSNKYVSTVNENEEVTMLTYTGSFRGNERSMLFAKKINFNYILDTKKQN